MFWKEKEMSKYLGLKNNPERKLKKKNEFEKNEIVGQKYFKINENLGEKCHGTKAKKHF